MREVEVLGVRIEELRSALRKALDGRKELLDPEILEISEELDEVLIQYYKVKGSKSVKPMIK
jgi:hypothetical protein